jgi:hypothetical protein
MVLFCFIYFDSHFRRRSSCDWEAILFAAMREERMGRRWARLSIEE